MYTKWAQDCTGETASKHGPLKNIEYSMVLILYQRTVNAYIAQRENVILPRGVIGQYKIEAGKQWCMVSAVNSLL